MLKLSIHLSFSCVLNFQLRLKIFFVYAKVQPPQHLQKGIRRIVVSTCTFSLKQLKLEAWQCAVRNLLTDQDIKFSAPPTRIRSECALKMLHFFVMHELLPRCVATPETVICYRQVYYDALVFLIYFATLLLMVDEQTNFRNAVSMMKWSTLRWYQTNMTTATACWQIIILQFCYLFRQLADGFCASASR